MKFADYLREEARIAGDARFCSLNDDDCAAIIEAARVVSADSLLTARLGLVAEAVLKPNDIWEASPYRDFKVDPRMEKLPPIEKKWGLALAVLFNVEAARAAYASRRIPECILVQSLYDLHRWIDTFELQSGGTLRGFSQVHWLRETLSLRLFQLGRLQFQIATLSPEVKPLLPDSSRHTLEECDAAPVIKVHIPRGPALEPASCFQELALAPNFFAKYFPNDPISSARFFLCNSWLLCKELTDALPESSHIRAFASLFTRGLPHSDKTSFFEFAFPEKGLAASADDAKTSVQRAILELDSKGVALKPYYGIRSIDSVRRTRPLRLGVLGSGTGSNMQSIQDAIEEGTLNAEITLVLTDVPGAKILDRAARHGIPARYIDHAPFKTKLEGRAEDEVISALRAADVEVVVLAGYMRVVKPKLLAAFPDRVINIHPALLPSFPGIAGWKQALDYGAKLAGCTVHFVNAGIDSGPIIVQRAVPVEDSDSPESLHARIQIQEHLAYPEALRLLAADRLLISGRRVISL